MNLNSEIGVLGNLKDPDKILSDLKTKLSLGTLPDIVCAKTSCWCGLCAPKAQDADTYKKIMQKYTL